MTATTKLLQMGAAGAAGEATYVEDVFSTYLYTGNGSTQTITNGIDLSGEGGMTWLKARTDTTNNLLFDTARGNNKAIFSNLTNAQTDYGGSTFVFDSSGFSIGTGSTAFNGSSINYASWTFRKAAKFFDVVTYTGNGNASQAINHNLGSTPGCVIVKRTDSTSFWLVWHRGYSSPSVSYGYLNSTDPFQPDSPNNNWAAAPTSTTFTPASNYNVNGATYVAYLFAHDAGGFGLTGTDNVISCGLTTANGSGDFSVNLGYEPQWILMKSTGSGIWSIIDNMRGMTASSGYTSSQRLQPQSSAAEGQLSSPYGIGINATGFTGNLATFSNDFIYIAIRRGPMKTPEVGTEVFSPGTATGNGVSNTFTTNFPVDLSIDKTLAVSTPYWIDRLRGGTQYLASSSTAAEGTYASNLIQFDSNTTIVNKNYGSTTSQYVDWMFRRAPGFFDVVCYTGTGSATTFNHNLGVAPELIIAKKRSAAGDSWAVYVASLTSSYYMLLNSTQAATLNTSRWTANPPTSTIFRVGTDGDTNDSGATYVAYLFATVAGVSKVGSYTGTGAAIQVNCGFTNGARFILIKRTDSTGNWYVWDSARGIVAGNDPYLLLNATNAEAAPVDTVDTYSAGFEVASTGGSELNANGGTYIFLAIA